MKRKDIIEEVNLIYEQMNDAESWFSSSEEEDQYFGWLLYDDSMFRLREIQKQCKHPEMKGKLCPDCYWENV